MEVIELAEKCHMRIRSQCRTTGDNSMRDWVLLSEEEKADMIKSVQHYLDNPNDGPDEPLLEHDKAKLNLLISFVNENRSQIDGDEKEEIDTEVDEEADVPVTDEPIMESYRPPVDVQDDENATETTEEPCENEDENETIEDTKLFEEE